jgi:hypothetical protein
MSRLRPRLPRLRPALPLALLLGVALVLGLAWTVANPPLQGPDESEHVGYVARLAETGKKPSASTGTAGAYGLDESAALTQLGFGPSRRHRFTKPPWSAEAERRFQVFEDALPDGAPGTADGPTSVGNNPPLYYAYAAIAWKLTPGGHFFGRIYAVRLFGVLALLSMVLCTWLLAGEVFGRRRLPQTVAAGFMALLPMNGFIAGIVNPDILLAAIWTAFLWVAVRTVRLGLTWQRSAVLSLIAVASFLTHGRGLAILPALAVALVVAWLRHHKTLGDTIKNAVAGAGVVVAGLIVYRFAFATGGAGGGGLYGSQTDLATSGAFNVRRFIASVWNFYLPRLDSTAGRLGPPIGYRQIFVQQYFAGIFGGFEVYFPYWVFDAVQVIVAVIVVALYTLGVLNWRRLLARWPVIVVLGATAFSMLFVLHFTSFRSLVGNGGSNPLIVGRYLLPLGGVFAILVATLVHALPRRIGAAVGAALLSVLLMLSVGGLAITVERFYA